MENCKEARKLGADIALFPEMWSCGYHIPHDLKKLNGLAIPAEGEFVTRYAELAKELDTAKGKLKVGSMICYDREFPESARIRMLKGAELALVPNACPMEINRLSQLRGRAYENRKQRSSNAKGKGEKRPSCFASGTVSRPDRLRQKSRLRRVLRHGIINPTSRGSQERRRAL